MDVAGGDSGVPVMFCFLSGPLCLTHSQTWSDGLLKDKSACTPFLPLLPSFTCAQSSSARSTLCLGSDLVFIVTPSLNLEMVKGRAERLRQFKIADTDIFHVKQMNLEMFPLRVRFPPDFSLVLQAASSMMGTKDGESKDLQGIHFNPLVFLCVWFLLCDIRSQDCLLLFKRG